MNNPKNTPMNNPKKSQLDNENAKIYINTKGQFVHENKVTGERFPITFDQFEIILKNI